MAKLSGFATPRVASKLGGTLALKSTPAAVTLKAQHVTATLRNEASGSYTRGRTEKIQILTDFLEKVT